MSGGLITNITPDHLRDLGSFMDYANVKGEFIKELNDRLYKKQKLIKEQTEQKKTDEEIDNEQMAKLFGS